MDLPPPPPITPSSRPPAGIVARMARERNGGGNDSHMTMVARMAKERESSGNNRMVNNNRNSMPGTGTSSPTPAPLAGSGRDAATISRVKLRKGKVRQARIMGVSSTSTDDSSEGGVETKQQDKYGNNVDNKDVDNQSTGSGMSRGSGSGRFGLKAARSRMLAATACSTPTAAKNSKAGPITFAPECTLMNDSAMKPETPSFSNNSNNNNSNNVHIGLPSLLSQDDATIESIIEPDVTETALYKKFDEAFDVTLHNNPGILPGAPAVMRSIKNAMFKVQHTKAQKETEMRKQLDQVKAEKDQLEAQLRKEMGTTAMRRSEMAKELEAMQREKRTFQDSLGKQMEAVEAMKNEMQLKMDNATAEKEELTKHLGFLSQSRSELEKALETEMALVEKDRDALQTVVAERKKLQKQKAENKELEGRIESMTQAASKEKKALQAEVVDLKKFEVHIAGVRRANENSKLELESTRLELKAIADTMQTKKMTLLESKEELGREYQKEIDELEGQIQQTKIMHEKDMEMAVKTRVMSYLRKDGGRDNEYVAHERGVEQEISPRGGLEAAPSFNIESMIKSRVEAELQRKLEADEAERAALQKIRDAEEAEFQQKREAEEAELRREREAEEAELQKKREAEEAKLQKQIDAERMETELRKRIEAELESRLEAELQKKRKEEEAEIQRKRKDEDAEMQRKRKEEEIEMQRKMKGEEAEMQRKRIEDEVEARWRKRMEEEQAAAKRLRRKKKSLVEPDSDDEEEDSYDELEETKENKKTHKQKNIQSNNPPSDEDKMQREIEKLREELQLVQARNPIHEVSPSRIVADSSHRNYGNEVREEIESLRGEIKLSHVSAAGAYSSRPPASNAASPFASPSPRNAAGRRSSYQREGGLMASPRYTHRGGTPGSNERGLGAYGERSYGERNSYGTAVEGEQRLGINTDVRFADRDYATMPLDHAEADVEQRLGINTSVRIRDRDRDYANPPLSQRSARSRGGRSPGYYF